MSRHRAEPPPTYRPRYGRIGVLALSLVTTAVGLLGGLGVLPSSAEGDGPRARTAAADVALDPVGRDDTPGDTQAQPVGPTAAEALTEPRARTGAADASLPEPPVPASSGEGRRAVFSEADQRVWLVGDDEEVLRTYLVSGSLTDNLQPGTYEVYSRSENAYGIDDSGTMKWFVRFTQGPTGAAIGFHDIPVDDGATVQTKAQLGTEQSHGCIRQRTRDAKAMWDFAPIGTTVVVV
jgi:hypothetical protein